MPWRYELRGADNRLVELRRGFASEAEAREAADREMRKIKSLNPKMETLSVVTGADPERMKAATYD